MDNAPQGKQVIPVIRGAFEMEGEEPHLIGTRCSKCGKAFFPPRSVCSYCLTDEGIEPARLGNRGKLYAYTVINVASREFNPPYPFGFVIIEPEMIRIPTLLTEMPDQEILEAGTEMEMVVTKLRDDKEGNEIVTYKFRPVAND